MNALMWASQNDGVLPPDQFYCATRDVVQARVEKFKLVLERISNFRNAVPLMTAIVAELTVNCFDHNLGTWRDMPGCWLEWDLEDHLCTVKVADRGQGILGSLKRVRPNLVHHREAVHLAFTEQLSGRAPERRGNGLKFIIRSLNQLNSPHFIFCSGDASLCIACPVDHNDLDRYIKDGQKVIAGTYAELTFKV